MSSNSGELVTHVEMGAKDPTGGLVFTLALSMISMAVISVCLAQRLAIVVRWKKLPVIRWLILIIYGDSLTFIFVSALVVHGLGLNTKLTCALGLFLCLTFYFTTKIFIYIFLVEKVRLVSNGFRSRHKDPLYMFNCFGMLLPYAGVYILNYFYRIDDITSTGHCRIGMKHESLLPTIVFDVIVNIYLTTLFLGPVIKLPTYRNGVKSPLRRMAVKTFFGSCFTLASSVTNLTTVMILRGETGWICLMLCNADILFSALVLHFITTDDHQGTQNQEPNIQSPVDKYGSYSELEKTRAMSCAPVVHYSDPKFHPNFFVPGSPRDPLHLHTTVSTEIKANKSRWSTVKDCAFWWKNPLNHKNGKIKTTDILVSVNHEQVVEISPIRSTRPNPGSANSRLSKYVPKSGERDSMKVEEIVVARPLIARLPSYNKEYDAGVHDIEG